MLPLRLLAISAFLLTTSVRADEPSLEITADTVLDPTKVYGPIIIKASNITIDGRGAEVVGSTTGNPKGFKGVGIFAKGVSKVTLKNVKAKGWETGLRIEDGKFWTVENCDFSDNFHDPEFGWGEQGRRGGIVLERVQGSTLRKNKANRVWDACVLVDSDSNKIVQNDFSHTSNTCLKLWHSSDNLVGKNNLSYGLRIKTGEVHARDSTCVLIESGSNENRFSDNDCTHGGDGIFIRVLNGWVSTGNAFTKNDVSYANNNGFEAWSPRNTYIENKANHCSYGFWLGASDKTLLLRNEASYNGDPKGFHNSPHLPNNGHAGIVFMFGPSSHTRIYNNTCVGNNGAGIAVLGDQGTKGAKWKAFHWVLEGNTLADNRWGIYARYADWIDLVGNTFRNNTAADFDKDASVTNVSEYPGGKPPRTMINRSVTAADTPIARKVGDRVWIPSTLDQSDDAKPEAVRWDLGDGTISTEPHVAHVFREAGFYRVGMTVNNGRSASLDWRDLYIVDDLPEIGTDGDLARWSWNDEQSKVIFTEDSRAYLAGHHSIRAEVRPYSGGRVNFVYSAPQDSLISSKGKTSLIFWIRSQNGNVTGWQGPNPVVTLLGPDGKSRKFTPKGDLLAQPAYNEGREGWTRIVVPLKADAAWEVVGDEVETIKSISIGLDSWGNDPLTVWIDGMGLR
ncbi:MAG: hypothetical protein JWN86_2889 [Planctomycetota bacterium]|nr:hypothetical protein [Planctomycetota bacterium]